MQRDTDAVREEPVFGPLCICECIGLQTKTRNACVRSGGLGNTGLEPQGLGGR
ncbi:hypothetical protein ASPCADRAFT_203409 [Aspergillus carbonarius ITEM 5010]|uniref:Uncharacterized protein n=1 Tax=Aspergillus carbonarius (strain ITEM 5010) TaxID=602072 RepID=A0A1R3RYQ7_ASPC5|nr:hypothetical protein ASPCADRAFT_203409 [Aspergillus carbonarius ITEM 5010]